MTGQPFQNEDQLYQTTGRVTLESVLDYPPVAGSLAEAAVSKDYEGAVDTAPVPFWTMGYDHGRPLDLEAVQSGG